MTQLAVPRFTKRYKIVTDEKAGGATYTPALLGDFVARQILKTARMGQRTDAVRILDPAIGDGDLLISLLKELNRDGPIEVNGFETNRIAISRASSRLRQLFPNIVLNFHHASFLEHVLGHFGGVPAFETEAAEQFDLIIANPPYVRTQIMGARQAGLLADQFGLTGRVDLYYAFIMAMAHVLKPHGAAGIIVSNRFMTTKSGAAVRAGLRENFVLRQVWDLGDTKLFDAAVLPAVLIVEGKDGQSHEPVSFTSIYETKLPADMAAIDAIAALAIEGVIAIPDGRRFRVTRGQLDEAGKRDAVWRLATKARSEWLDVVRSNTWKSFREIGKVRVGVKTCADKVFIRNDWDKLPRTELPELLRPLTTHHAGRRFRPVELSNPRRIVYPHESTGFKRRAVDLRKYPRTRSYLERHRAELEARKYVLEAGRQWYEIWVPQDPSAWARTKLVFRDISENPTFWIDESGSVINGDCYWIVADRPADENLLWLAAAVANSTFAEAFYDHRFNNKLYAGRRRFITQYVEMFPLPNPNSRVGRQLIELAKEIYKIAGTPEGTVLERSLNRLVWKAFGLSEEEIGG